MRMHCSGTYIQTLGNFLIQEALRRQYRDAPFAVGEQLEFLVPIFQTCAVISLFLEYRSHAGNCLNETLGFDGFLKEIVSAEFHRLYRDVYISVTG